MKVKITKTIDVNHLPMEVRKMLDQAKNNLVYGLPEGINQVLMHCYSSEGQVFFQAIDLIDSLRQDLAELDESLQEAQNILSWYKEALTPKQEQEQVYDEEWLAKEEAEAEKRQAQQMDAEGAENEEG
jgi:polyribonucleotide nucleotidyltransferase